MRPETTARNVFMALAASGIGCGWMARHPEHQYLDLIHDVFENGSYRGDRTGTGTYAVFGRQMRYSIENNTLPLLTTKKVALRSIIHEVLFFINGRTDSKKLARIGVPIWNGNGTKEFIKKATGKDRDEGDLGPVYGFQWRHFGAEYKDCYTDYTGEGVDQLQKVIDTIKSGNIHDRRMVVSAWNPVAAPLMVLPPCPTLFQFYVSDRKLSCALYQRSGDIGLGVPFNIASYSILTYIVAHLTGLETGEFVHFIGDTHIYTDHVLSLKEQCRREPRPFPKFYIRPDGPRNRLEDFKFEDFVLEDYAPHPAIKMKMSA
ncbi:MAG: thymidylate synthase [Amphiamblys sp. WSBS2006]|nr:MAG: thymidylate synthase [Amphiamblys sp. WSBS2006]